MAADMDIDMDLDIDIDVDIPLDEPQPILSMQPESSPQAVQQTVQADPEASEPAPNKVHIRGLDNLTTKDIKAFAEQYYSMEGFEKVEWIDDTSANLIYIDADTARQALNSFAAEDISGAELTILHSIPAKEYPGHPETRLEVRMATVGDRKQAGARDRSRFYLFNPEHDRHDRRSGGGRGGRSYRDRDDGDGYRSNRYDDREDRRRQADSSFDASLYDDDEQSLAKRRTSSSEGRYADRRGRAGAGKELFPERIQAAAGGRLDRDRSASPMRDEDGDTSMAFDAAEKERRRNRNDAGSKENRYKASLIKSTLREAAAPRELFPARSGTEHRRSSALARQDETADLFASKASISDTRTNSGSLSSRITRPGEQSNIINIRGTADTDRLPGLSIKGASKVKELFPVKAGSGNAGKELFGNRGVQRRRAEDLFH